MSTYEFGGNTNITSIARSMPKIIGKRERETRIRWGWGRGRVPQKVQKPELVSVRNRRESLRDKRQNVE